MSSAPHNVPSERVSVHRAGRRTGVAGGPTLDGLIERRASAGTVASGLIYITSITVVLVCYLAFAWPISGARVDVLFVPSLLLGMLSVYSFLACGGVVINASSVTSLGLFLFGGFAGIYTSWGLNAARATSLVTETLVGLTILYLFQLLIVVPSIVVRGRLPVGPTGAVPQRPVVTSRLAPRMILGICMLGIAILDAVLGGRILLAPIGVVGILVAIDGSFCARKRSTLFFGSLAALFLSWIYYEYVFRGFGRLVLGVLFCAMAVLYSVHIRRRAIKLAVVMCVAVAIPLLARQRLSFLKEYRGSMPLDSEGSGSIVGPLISFAQLIQASADGRIPLAMGRSYMDAATLWIPRAIWPEKPVGFGVSIVSITQPNLAGSRIFSDAPLFGGELVWNFGVAGAVLAIPLIAFCVRVLDRSLLSPRIVGSGYANSISRIFVAVVCASLLHFVWGGSYTYVARTFVMLAALSLLYIHARLHTEGYGILSHRGRRRQHQISHDTPS